MTKPKKIKNPHGETRSAPSHKSRPARNFSSSDKKPQGNSKKAGITKQPASQNKPRRSQPRASA